MADREREQNEVLSKPISTHLNLDSEEFRKKKQTVVDDVAVLEDFTDFSLAKTISKIEDEVNDDATGEQLEDDVMPSTAVEMGAEAQIRFLKAKLRVVQEELNRLSHECNKKDEGNGVLSSKLKEVEEDRVRLQRMTSLQQTQLEKHRALAEDANRNCDSLRQQVTALQKARLMPNSFT
ncbi:testis-expressed protein 9 isoform X1 [Silurus asotus]|uniref:Testis-expressed protein 9 isoform X1 n=1 Tax=Silurus asotus TaxID=30991 RepID=A0AAD5B008_SILAS|nr:testis-expressed protein 9 isoform X1 [Silurus asotus]